MSFGLLRVLGLGKHEDPLNPSEEIAHKYEKNKNNESSKTNQNSVDKAGKILNERIKIAQEKERLERQWRREQTPYTNPWGTDVVHLSEAAKKQINERVKNNVTVISQNPPANYEPASPRFRHMSEDKLVVNELMDQSLHAGDVMKKLPDTQSLQFSLFLETMKDPYSGETRISVKQKNNFMSIVEKNAEETLRSPKRAMSPVDFRVMANIFREKDVELSKRVTKQGLAWNVKSSLGEIVLHLEDSSQIELFCQKFPALRKHFFEKTSQRDTMQERPQGAMGNISQQVPIPNKSIITKVIEGGKKSEAKTSITAPFITETPKTSFWEYVGKILTKDLLKKAISETGVNESVFNILKKEGQENFYHVIRVLRGMFVHAKSGAKTTSQLHEKDFKNIISKTFKLTPGEVEIAWANAKEFIQNLNPAMVKKTVSGSIKTINASQKKLPIVDAEYTEFQHVVPYVQGNTSPFAKEAEIVEKTSGIFSGIRKKFMGLFGGK